MPTRIDLLMLVVRDMEASARFYRDILRLPVAYQSPSWTELGPPEGTHLALYPENQAAGILVRPGSTSLGFYIYDVDGFVYEARNRGARVEREPANEEFGRYAELRDPDGYLIGLCRPKGMPVAEEIHVPATPPAARPAHAQGILASTVIPADATTPKGTPVRKAGSGTGTSASGPKASQPPPSSSKKPASPAAKAPPKPAAPKKAAAGKAPPKKAQAKKAPTGRKSAPAAKKAGSSPRPQKGPGKESKKASKKTARSRKSAARKPVRRR